MKTELNCFDLFERFTEIVNHQEYCRQEYFTEEKKAKWWLEFIDLQIAYAEARISLAKKGI